MNKLIFQTSPIVTLATNKFINVPVILKFDDTNLIEIVREDRFNFTTKIPIYHSDGTELAVARGNRLFPTEIGKKAGITIDKYVGLWVCKMDNKPLFEIRLQTGDSFKISAELYAPEGYFVKCTDSPTPQIIDISGEALKIGGITMSGCLFRGVKTGIWLKKDGSFLIGVNI